MHAHLGLFDLGFVFAEPVINALVEQHAAPVRVDVDAIVVRPWLVGVKFRLER